MRLQWFTLAGSCVVGVLIVLHVSNLKRKPTLLVSESYLAHLSAMEQAALGLGKGSKLYKASSKAQATTSRLSSDQARQSIDNFFDHIEARRPNQQSFGEWHTAKSRASSNNLVHRQKRFAEAISAKPSPVSSGPRFAAAATSAPVTVSVVQQQLQGLGQGLPAGGDQAVAQSLAPYAVPAVPEPVSPFTARDVNLPPPCGKIPYRSRGLRAGLPDGGRPCSLGAEREGPPDRQMLPADDPKMLQAIDLELQQIDPAYARLRRAPRPDEGPAGIAAVFRASGKANPLSDFTDPNQGGRLGLYRNQVRGKSDTVWKGQTQALAQQ